MLFIEINNTFWYSVDKFRKILSKAHMPSLFTAQKMKFSMKYFFSKCDQIRSFQRIWLNLLKISLLKNFIFLCSVY